MCSVSVPYGAFKIVRSFPSQSGWLSDQCRWSQSTGILSEENTNTQIFTVSKSQKPCSYFFIYKTVCMYKVT